MLTYHLQDPDMQKPSLFVLISNALKSVALRKLFGTKKAQKFRNKRYAGKIHLHLESSSIFYLRLILITDRDLSQQSLRAKAAIAERCHEIIRQAISDLYSTLDRTADSIYSRFLLLFADIFCFFSADIGSFRQIACYIAV
jgi:hypothetical protein